MQLINTAGKSTQNTSVESASNNIPTLQPRSSFFLKAWLHLSFWITGFCTGFHTGFDYGKISREELSTCQIPPQNFPSSNLHLKNLKTTSKENVTPLFSVWHSILLEFKLMFFSDYLTIMDSKTNFFILKKKRSRMQRRMCVNPYLMKRQSKGRYTKDVSRD